MIRDNPTNLSPMPKGGSSQSRMLNGAHFVDRLFEDLPPHASILSPISNPSQCINVVAELDFRWRVRASRTDGLALLRRTLLKAAHEIWRGGTVYLKSRAASASCFVRGAAGKDRTRSGCDTQGPADGD